MVAFVVGPKEEVYTVHKNFATLDSPVFRAAFSKHWVEGQRGAYTLDETEPQIFEMFLQWIYGRPVAYIVPKGEGQHYLDPYIRLWLFADEYQVPKLQNSLMRWFTRDYASVELHYFHHSIVMEIYEKTTEGSPLRTWIAFEIASRLLLKHELKSVKAQFLFRERAEKYSWTQEILLDILEAVFLLPWSGSLGARASWGSLLVDEELPSIQ